MANLYNFLKKEGYLSAIYDGIYIKSNEQINLDDDYKFDLIREVVCIDVGYGNVKFGYIDDEGNLKYSSFPSLTPLAPNLDMSSGIFEKRNTKIVNVNTIKYEVGYDVEKVDNGSDANRNLNESYTLSDSYHALFLGALEYINKENIDLLVMGLPVKFMNYSSKLIEKFQKEHVLSDGRKCVVKCIKVIPQPMGSFYNFAVTKNKFNDFNDGKTLIVDAGFLTLDFLCLTGTIPIENRSDAVIGGMSSVLNAIATSISTELGVNYSDYNSIDKALRNAKEINKIRGRNKTSDESKVQHEERQVIVNGKSIYLKEHIKQSAPVINSAVTYMHNKVKTFNDINNIILSGGSSNVFEKKIKEMVGDGREILSSHNADGKYSIFDNVNGYVFFGVIELIIENELNKNNLSNQEVKVKNKEKKQDEE